MMLVDSSVVALIIVSMFCSVDVQGTEMTSCSMEQRSRDLDTCLDSIVAMFEDNDLFWFGTVYPQNCPAADKETVDCYLIRPLSGDSIASAIFTPGTFDSSTVDRYMDVTYTSRSGEYTGCGHTHVTPLDKVIVLEPTSNETITPWDARDKPEVTWMSDVNKQYTLLIHDAANGRVHGLYINIPGNDIDKGKVITAYRGPLNVRSLPNPYAFLLFEQEDMDMGLATYTQDISEVFNTTEFVRMNNLVGPKAVTWMLIGRDLYSAETMRTIGLAENCSPFITAALREEPIIFQDWDTSMSLPGYSEVTISNTDTLEFSYCCQSYTYPPEDTVLNPLGNPTLLPASVRSASNVDVVLSKTGIFPNKTADFKDQLFTAIMVDPDIPPEKAAVGTRELPLLHWMAYNLEVSPEGHLTGGSVERSYKGPMPPPLEPRVHGYYTMVYKQPGALTLNSTEYADNCSEPRLGRCRFNVTSLVKVNNLELFAASWMKAENDDYVQFSRNINQSVDCAGRSTYSEPCTSASTRVYLSLVVLLLTAVIPAMV